MKTTLHVIFFLLLLCGGKIMAQPNIFNPNDAVTTYSSSRPPATPPANTMAKWVRTARMSWSTSRFKCYYWNGMAFRLRFPNNYNPADTTKKYPLILFFHGGGEVANVYDNEYHLIWGAQRFESAINAGQYDAFMLFPQASTPAWSDSYFVKINNVLDSLQKYCRVDPDRVIPMGLSMGGFGAVYYSQLYPKRSSTVISSAPALIQTITNNVNDHIHVPMWLGSGDQDVNPNPDHVKAFVDAFSSKGGSIRWTVIPGLSHVMWNEQWDQPYLYPYWKAAHKANPLVFYQRNVFCPDSAIDARMGITAGFYQYQWQKDLVDIPGGTANEIIATQLGSYRVRFKRTAGSAWSDWSPNPAVISPRAAMATPAVTVNGMRSIVLPAPDGSTTVPLQLPAGYLTYEWRRTSDNTLVGTQSTFNAPPGQYKGLISGCNRTFSPVFTVVNANGTPRPDSARNLTLARLSPTSFKLTWADVATPVYNETGFEIYRSKTAGGPYTLIFVNPANNKTYTDDSLSENYNYYYRIRAVNATGAAGLSNEASLAPKTDSIAPTAPANVKVLLTSHTSVELDWENATDNTAVTGYDIYVNGVKKYTTATSSVVADNLAPNTTFTFTVKAFDQAGNTSGFSNAVSATSNANGLKYRYYEGNWDNLPNFNLLTPVKTGTSPNIDLGVRTTGVNDYYAFVWEGYINIQTPGTYTFETASDDGSKLYFNTFYDPAAAAVVSNDGVHGPWTPVTGSVNIPEAGLYPITITFFEKSQGEAMQLYWSGPGITRQLIPNTAFTEQYQPPADNIAPSTPASLKADYTGRTFVDLDWDNATDNTLVTGYDVYVNGVKKYTTPVSSISADGLTPNTTYTFTVKAVDKAGNASAASNAATTTTTAKGLKYSYYEGNWDNLPDFDTLTAVKTGTSNNIDLSVRPSGVNDYFGFVWEGYINIKTPGTYTFETASDDGSKVYFNTLYNPAVAAVVNNDGVHGPWTPVTGTVNIPAAGIYPITITFFEKNSGEAMQLYWSGPGIARQLIPNAAFTETFQLPTDNVAPSVPANVKAVFTSRTFIDLDWDDATDNTTVTGYDVYVNGVKKNTTPVSSITVDSLAPGTSYTFTIKALDQAGNASAFSTAVTATSTANGLKYNYYEGDWNVLPNFKTLTPVKTGSSPNIDLGMRPAGVNDYFGFVWEGYINIKTPGTYTFETASDDGSKVYFNTLYNPAAAAVVNNDGVHGPWTPVTGTVNIPAAGIYPITITFFEKNSGEAMQLYWSGPGIARQLIPNAAFTETFQLPADNVAPSVPANVKAFTSRTFIDLDWDDATDNTGVTGYQVFVNGVKKYTTTASSVTVDSLAPNNSYTFTVKAFDLAGNSSAFSTAITATSSANGLKYKYYEGNWDTLPNFNTMAAVKTGSSPNIDLGVRPAGVNDYFGFVWEGYINIKTPGTYTFETVSDDGSKVYFNAFYNPGAGAIVNNDGIHGPWSPVTGTVNIPAAGMYPITITFFEKNSGEAMQLYWSGPGIARQLIPNAAFTENFTPSATPALANTGNNSSLKEATAAGANRAGQDKVKAYPNPFKQQFRVDFYTATPNSQVSIDIYSMNGTLVLSRTVSGVPEGSNSVNINVEGTGVKEGMYLMRVHTNGVPSKMLRLVSLSR